MARLRRCCSALLPLLDARAQLDAPSVTPRDPTPTGRQPIAPARPARRALRRPRRRRRGRTPTPRSPSPPTRWSTTARRGLVTARGKVEAWQGERLLRADLFTYDRNTGTATATGNVQLLEPDGSVLFADSAELKDRFRDGVLEGVRALLAANGKMAANGARRTGGTVNELSRVVYSSCDLCKDDPTAPPLWQVQARRATQDKDALRISYRDATVRLFGFPVLYTPYLSHPDPSTPRASGFLFPTLGYTRFLGGFFETPYFWAIDQTSDLTITPIVSTRQLPNLGLEYRKLFNSGEILGSASIGGLNGKDTGGKEELAGHIFLKGRFTVDENWRVGFDLNRASSEIYLRTFRYEYRRVLTSQVYTEGFWGTEGYVRMDAPRLPGAAHLGRHAAGALCAAEHLRRAGAAGEGLRRQPDRGCRAARHLPRHRQPIAAHRHQGALGAAGDRPARRPLDLQGAGRRDRLPRPRPAGAADQPAGRQRHARRRQHPRRGRLAHALRALRRRLRQPRPSSRGCNSSPARAWGRRAACRTRTASTSNSPMPTCSR